MTFYMYILSAAGLKLSRLSWRYRAHKRCLLMKVLGLFEELTVVNKSDLFFLWLHFQVLFPAFIRSAAEEKNDETKFSRPWII